MRPPLRGALFLDMSLSQVPGQLAPFEDSYAYINALILLPDLKHTQRIHLFVRLQEILSSSPTHFSILELGQRYERFDINMHLITLAWVSTLSTAVYARPQAIQPPEVRNPQYSVNPDNTYQKPGESAGVNPLFWKNCQQTANALCANFQDPSFKDKWHWNSDGPGCQAGVWIPSDLDPIYFAHSDPLQDCFDEIMILAGGFNNTALTTPGANRGSFNVKVFPDNSQTGQAWKQTLPSWIVQG